MSKSHLSEKIEQKKTFEQVSVRYIAPTDETFNRKMQLVSVDQGLWMKSERKEKPKRENKRYENYQNDYSIQKELLMF